MPKLSAKMQTAVANEEARDFEAFAPGIYEAKLIDVKQVVAKSSGADMLVWEWEFTKNNPKESRVAGRKLWENTVLDEKSAWKVKQVWETALGYSPDSDTDEMIGELARIDVDVEVQEQGKGEGQLRNVIKRVLPHQPGTAAAVSPGAGGGQQAAAAAVQNDPWG